MFDNVCVPNSATVLTAPHMPSICSDQSLNCHAETERPVNDQEMTHRIKIHSVQLLNGVIFIHSENTITCNFHNTSYLVKIINNCIFCKGCVCVSMYVCVLEVDRFIDFAD